MFYVTSDAVLTFLNAEIQDSLCISQFAYCNIQWLVINLNDGTLTSTITEKRLLFEFATRDSFTLHVVPTTDAGAKRDAKPSELCTNGENVY